MATTKITELTSLATVLAVADLVPIVDATDSTTKKVTVQKIVDLVIAEILASDLSIVLSITGELIWEDKIKFAMDGNDLVMYYYSDAGAWVENFRVEKLS